jgi:ferredoxin
MGHDCYAGYLREIERPGSVWYRIDVPEAGGIPAYTKLFGPGAIFSITLVTEDAARAKAASLKAAPFYIPFAAPQLGYDPEEEEEEDEEPRRCRVCGCTDLQACPGGCFWVEEDLCSQCSDKVGETGGGGGET